MSVVKIGTVQIAIERCNTQYNLVRVVSGLNKLAREGVRLAVLPEMWAAGFTLDDLPGFASETPQLLNSLQAVAARHGMAIVGSLPEEEHGRYYNTAFFLDGTRGLIGKYRKMHPFPPTSEDRYFAPGHELPVFDLDFAKVGVAICYDLRFPELFRNLCGKGATVLAVCAQWPAVRVEHWRALTSARAIENQCFMVATNCCGTDGEIIFAGRSRVIAPDGSVLLETRENECFVATDIDPAQVARTRGFFDTTPSHTRPLHSYRDKVMPADAARELITRLKLEGKRVVFTNGCFDILHVGHARYLAEARNQGDFLLVAVNADESVRAIKGPDRPVNSETSRAEVLAALACVDAVVLFSDDTPYALIDAFRPDVLVKGSDWEEKDIVGADIVKSYGGRVARIPLVEGASTTGIIERIARPKAD